MNDPFPSFPPQSPPPPPPQPPAFPNYKDRSGALVFFGILTMLLGCISLLLIPLMLLGRAAATMNHAGNQLPASSLVPAMAIYGVLGAALVWMGVGTIRARRWARALMLVFSWSWLIMGILTTAIMVRVMPSTMAAIPAASQPGQPPMPPGVMAGVMTFMFAFFGIIFVLMPAVWTAFYSSRHVKATCQHSDPGPSWTDACPLPVLAICLWLALCVPMMLMTPLMARPALAFFGTFLTGTPAGICYLVMTVLWAYSAWSLYKLRTAGWWIVLIVTCLTGASTAITFSHHGMIDLYKAMDYPPAQIAQLQASPFMKGNGMGWLMACTCVPFLGYLLFIRRYLRVQR
jgi:hypothetical protein